MKFFYFDDKNSEVIDIIYALENTSSVLLTLLLPRGKAIPSVGRLNVGRKIGESKKQNGENVI